MASSSSNPFLHSGDRPLEAPPSFPSSTFYGNGGEFHPRTTAGYSLSSGSGTPTTATSVAASTATSSAYDTFDLLNSGWNTEAEEFLFATEQAVASLQLPPLFSSSAVLPAQVEAAATTSTTRDFASSQKKSQKLQAPVSADGGDDDEHNGNNKVKHDYHDHANDPDGDYAAMGMAHNTPCFVDQTFPVRLHYMLSEIGKDGLDHIVSWQPHGRCFVVHDQKAFCSQVLGK